MSIESLFETINVCPLSEAKATDQGGFSTPSSLSVIKQSPAFSSRGEETRLTAESEYMDLNPKVVGSSPTGANDCESRRSSVVEHRSLIQPLRWSCFLHPDCLIGVHESGVRKNLWVRIPPEWRHSVAEWKTRLMPSSDQFLRRDPDMFD